LHTRLAGNLCFHLWFLGAFFDVLPQKTGLSAAIPRPAYAVLRDFRFNPSYDYCQEAMRSPAKPHPSMLSPFRFPLFF
jgi:hypothetical protein